MKKKFWIGILTAVLLLNLLPGMTPSASADDASSWVFYEGLSHANIRTSRTAAAG